MSELSSDWESFPLAGLSLSLLATIPTSFLVLSRYRRAVARTMRDLAPGAGPPREAAAIRPEWAAGSLQAPVALEVVDGSVLPAPTGEAALLERASRRTLRSAAWAHVIASTVFAFAATLTVLRLEDLALTAHRLILVPPVFAWLLIPALALVTGDSRSWGLGAVILGLVWTLGLSWGSDLSPLFVVHALIPSVLALAIGNRWMKTVAPVLLLLFLLLAIGLLVGSHSLLFGLGQELTRLASVLGVLAAMVLCASAIAVPFVLGFLYRRRFISDQMLVIGTWWLVYSLWIGMLLSRAPGPLLFVVVFLFLAFSVTLGLAFRALGQRRSPAANRPLLILRVFGFRRRSERLLRELKTRWRPLGSVELIAGSDLATENLEPHELVGYLTGRLTRSFVSSAEPLAALRSDAERRDPDGRFRTHEYFCFENTWRQTVRALVDRVSVALMDLRGFKQKNAGCAYELGLLTSSFPLSRLVLLVDGSTDLDHLREFLAKSRLSTEGRAPGEDGLRTVRALDVGRLGTRMPRATMRMLCEAACS